MLSILFFLYYLPLYNSLSSALDLIWLWSQSSLVSTFLKLFHSVNISVPCVFCLFLYYFVFIIKVASFTECGDYQVYRSGKWHPKSEGFREKTSMSIHFFSKGMERLSSSGLWYLLARKQLRPENSLRFSEPTYTLKCLGLIISMNIDFNRNHISLTWIKPWWTPILLLLLIIMSYGEHCIHPFH